MSGYLALVGRLLFAALFLASGVQKLQTFGKDGGPGLDLLSPKIDTVLGHVKTQSGYEVPLQKEHHVYILGALIALELLGSVLFIANWRPGAYALATVLLITTPLTHDFWTVKDETIRNLELVSFLKNLALFGSLLFWAGPVSPRRFSSYKLD